MIRISIADDYEVYRDGLKVGLSADPNLVVVSEAENGLDLLRAIASEPPDVIIMDLKMPVMDGMEATKRVRALHPDVKILVVSMYEDDTFLIRLMQHGANGYLIKNAEPEELRKAIYALQENGYYFNDNISRSLLKKLILENNLNPRFNDRVELTKEERTILLNLAVEDAPHAADANISETLLDSLIRKIGVRNTAGLVMFAVTQGVFD